MDEEKAEQKAGIDGYLFRLVATFEAAAMQQLGKIAHPLTGDVEVTLEGARDSIGMLEAIRRKTEGNLNEDEERFLEHVLYQLRMNYVDVAREQGEKGAEAEDGADSEDEERDASGPEQPEGGAKASDKTEPPGDDPESEAEGGDESGEAR